MSSHLALLRAAAFGGIALLAVPQAASALTFSTVYTFQGGSDGANPLASVLDVSGNLFGTTTLGGVKGTLYELTPPATAGGAWGETVLHKFADAINPASVLIPYKTSVLGTSESDTSATAGGTVFQLKPLVSPPGTWKEIILHAFGSAGDGTAPTAGMIKYTSAYYGTTTAGGISGCTGVTTGPGGCGTIFKMTAPAVAGGAWTESVLYAFKGGPDGAEVGASLLNQNGTFYGTTALGGTGTCAPANTSGGCGTVFSVTSLGVKTTLYSFVGGKDGSTPTSKLIYYRGAYYGTTSTGGGTGCGGSGCGTVFKMRAPAVAGGAWTEKVIHAFTGGSDGANPESGLVAVNGTLYGTTSTGGGTGCGGPGCGTVFNIGLQGGESVVYAFQGASDGAFPVADLVDIGGTLYGTAEFGGTATCPGGKTVSGYTGCGVVFQIK